MLYTFRISYEFSKKKTQSNKICRLFCPLGILILTNAISKLSFSNTPLYTKQFEVVQINVCVYSKHTKLNQKRISDELLMWYLQTMCTFIYFYTPSVYLFTRLVGACVYTQAQRTYSSLEIENKLKCW